MSSVLGFESSRVSADSRAGLIYLAKLAEQAERFDDMKVRLVLFLSLPPSLFVLLSLLLLSFAAIMPNHFCCALNALSRPVLIAAAQSHPRVTLASFLLQFYMRKIALMVAPASEGAEPQRLSRDERSYLSVAYKNVVGLRRAAWRVLNAPDKLDAATESSMESQLQNYARVVESELNVLCDDIVDLISNALIPHADETEEFVFYQKMAGDYFRYKAEFLRDESRDAAVASSKEWYSKALTQANGEGDKAALASTDPIRLGLILNYSVFMYEIEGDHTAACEVAKKGFDGAVEELESLGEEVRTRRSYVNVKQPNPSPRSSLPTSLPPLPQAYKDATLIMQLLRDNLALWSSKDE